MGNKNAPSTWNVAVGNTLSTFKFRQSKVPIKTGQHLQVPINLLKTKKNTSRDFYCLHFDSSVSRTVSMI